jgi:tetratricopeptide (TPR) repeat protein
LLQQAAESVYARTQPYRYAVYLGSQNPNDQSRAEAAYRKLAENGSLQDRAWAFIGLSTVYHSRNQQDENLRVLHKALALRPNFAIAILDIAGAEGQAQHDENALIWNRKLVAALRSGDSSDMDPRSAALNAISAQASIANLVGDYKLQLVLDAKGENLPDSGGLIESFHQADMVAYAFMHDGAGLHNVIADNSMSTDRSVIINRTANLFGSYAVLGRWRDTRALADTLEVMASQIGPGAISFEMNTIRPYASLAMAMLGDVDGARRRIEHTPLDCDLCGRMRGRVAAVGHHWDAAAYWFNMVAQRSPSIPFANTDWGMMLLSKGDAAGAIEKFKAANRQGPHFADPLEGWGEALMMQNRSDLALAKFKQANAYAPNWGRLHLKWGEALVYSGDKDEAKKQFAVAAGLDLTAAERRELAKISR